MFFKRMFLIILCTAFFHIFLKAVSPLLFTDRRRPGCPACVSNSWKVETERKRLSVIFKIKGSENDRTDNSAEVKVNEKCHPRGPF